MSKSAAAANVVDETADHPEDGGAGDEYSPTFFERILPDGTLARWAIYLVIILAVAATLWFVVFPRLQSLLPEGF